MEYKVINGGGGAKVGPGKVGLMYRLVAGGIQVGCGSAQVNGNTQVGDEDAQLVVEV